MFVPAPEEEAGKMPGEARDRTRGAPDLNEARALFSARTLETAPWLSAYYFLRDLIIYSALSFAVLQTDSLLLLIPLWALLGLNILGLYQIGHDAAHGSLFRSPLVNYLVSQVSFLPCLHPHGKWRYGHNGIHHGNTVKLRGDLAWHPRSPERYRQMKPWARFLHRFYWSAWGAGPYYLIKMWLQGLIIFRAPTRGATRDTVLVLIFACVFAGAAFAWGASRSAAFDPVAGFWLVFKLQIMPFLIANYFLGVTVYIHHINPNIAWRGAETWTPYHGQIRGTTNYHVWGVVNFFIHNIFIHVPHHVEPAIPFYHLPRALEELRERFGADIHESKRFWRDYLAATRSCKLFDAEKGEWRGYPDAGESEGDARIYS